MKRFHEQKIANLENKLRQQEELFSNLKTLMRNLKNKIDEIKVLLKFHQEIIDLATKDQERKEYKIKECRKCGLGKYGGCESGYEDILYCKDLQVRLDKETGEES